MTDTRQLEAYLVFQLFIICGAVAAAVKMCAAHFCYSDGKWNLVSPASLDRLPTGGVVYCHHTVDFAPLGLCPESWSNTAAVNYLLASFQLAANCALSVDWRFTTWLYFFFTCPAVDSHIAVVLGRFKWRNWRPATAFPKASAQGLALGNYSLLYFRCIGFYSFPVLCVFLKCNKDPILQRLVGTSFALQTVFPCRSQTRSFKLFRISRISDLRGLLELFSPSSAG